MQQQERDAEASVAGQYAARKAQPPKTTVELARAIVRYQNGSFTLKGMLGAVVTCTEVTYPGVATVAPYKPGQPVHMNPGVPSIMDKCMTHVNYYTSPESQNAALMRQWETPGMMGHPDDAWQNAWVARNQQQMQAMTDQSIAASNRQFQAQQQIFAQQGAARQAQAQEFNHQQAVRQQMHEESGRKISRFTYRRCQNPCGDRCVGRATPIGPFVRFLCRTKFTEASCLSSCPWETRL